MSETSEREREDDVDAFAESPAERVDATARELFVREIERWGGVTMAPNDAVKLFARYAYEMASILESARPVQSAATSTQEPRPLAIGDRVRGLGGWCDRRGVVATVYEDEGRVCVDVGGGKAYVHGPAAEWEREP